MFRSNETEPERQRRLEIRYRREALGRGECGLCRYRPVAAWDKCVECMSLELKLELREIFRRDDDAEQKRAYHGGYVAGFSDVTWDQNPFKDDPRLKARWALGRCLSELNRQLRDTGDKFQENHLAKLRKLRAAAKKKVHRDRRG